MNESILSKSVRSLTLITATAVLCAGTLCADELEKAHYGNPECSNATLNGSFGLHFSGTIINVGPVAGVGLFTFDGQGNLSAVVTQKVNGNVVALTVIGTYTVSANCTVSDAWHASNGQTTTHESVLLENGREYIILNTTPGNVVSGVAKKQFSPGN